MAAKHIGLGRGLGALIKDTTPAEPAPAAAVAPAPRVPVAEIRKSPWQPRHQFDEQALAELVQSVRERGVLQPLLVRRVGAGYELIAGERRFRAAQMAGLQHVPATIMEVTDREALELALVENLQRADLNLIEEAEGYQALSDKFGLTQDEVAQKVGKARSTVTNALRLLGLTNPVKQLVAEGRLSPGHAKAMLGLENAREQEALALRVVEEGLSVRDVERLVARSRRAPRKPRAEKIDIPAEHVKFLVEQMKQKLGTGVRLTPTRTLANGKKIKGCLEIEFYSSEELDRLMVILGLGGQL